MRGTRCYSIETTGACLVTENAVCVKSLNGREEIERRTFALAPRLRQMLKQAPDGLLRLKEPEKVLGKLLGDLPTT